MHLKIVLPIEKADDYSWQEIGFLVCERFQNRSSVFHHEQ